MAQTTKKQAINLYAEMRPALVKAHNEGNTKPISKDLILGADIDITAFNMWTSKCKLLRDTTFDYVAKKKNARFSSEITQEMITEAREKIYPMWKSILGFGEKSKYEKELRCSESDVEDLIGFAWDFYNTGAGTAETIVKENVFRKKVESLLGCVIAQNEVLTEDERKTLAKYNKARNRQTQATQTIEDLNVTLKGYQLTLGGIPQSEAQKPFRDYVQNLINDVEKQIKESEEKLKTAQSDENAVKDQAQAIQKKMKAAK